ncbi:hypothetical protein ASG77_19050 [Arthrobacter sp. Soil762]|nr:hypothetical protein ASG77_19050 [Arthrobacter sp. Soil762]
MPEDEIPGGPVEGDAFPELHGADLRLPDNEPPDYALFSDDALPDGPLPEDPYPNWDFSLTAHSNV